MENLYIKFLQEFEQTGLSSKRSISRFIEKNFIKPLSDKKDQWNDENANAAAFLDDVKMTGHFTFDKRQDFDVYYSDIQSERRWYDVVDIDARLTIKGLDFWETHKASKRLERNSIRQTFLLLLTAIIAICGTIITIVNIKSDDVKNKQKLQLQDQSKQIHTLQIELSKITTLYSHELGVKKTSVKKP